jgi:hypothetical protein
LALATTALVVVVVVLWVVHQHRVGSRRVRRRNRASIAEREASTLLTAAGWEVLEVQPTCRWPLLIDGVETDVESRADFLVRRDGRLWIADAKSGRRAVSATSPATRRQLLEYLLAFEVDGVLLVDCERRAVIRVAFPMLPAPDPAADRRPSERSRRARRAS